MKHHTAGPYRVTTRRTAALIATLAATAFIATGCGSDDGGSGSTTSASTAGQATTAQSTAALDAAYAKMLKPPTTLGDLKPITKPIPTGKKIVYIYCGAPVCNLLADGVKRSAKVLGWNYQTIASDGTPESVKKAWQTAVRMKPAAVISSGYDTPVYKQELEQLKADKVFVANISTTDAAPNGGVDVRIGDPDNVGEQGDMMATWIAKDSGQKANTLFVDVPSFAILKGSSAHFDKTYAEFCPGCKSSKIDLPITALGKDAPQRVVSYLRAHPDVNYVAFALDGADIGLPAALKAAGLADKVKFVGGSGTVENLDYIKQGQQGGTVNQGFYEETAMLVDAAARFTVGEDISTNQKLQVPYWFETKESMPSKDGFKPQLPDLYGQVAKLWGKASR